MIVAHFRRHQVPQKETWLDLSGWTEGDTMYDWEELEERSSRCNCHCSQGSLTRWH